MAHRQDMGGRRRLTRLVKRSFSLAGHRTSVALEAEFWSALTRIAVRDGDTLSALVSNADAKREPLQPLASALRVLALQAFDVQAAAGAASQRVDQPANMPAESDA